MFHAGVVGITMPCAESGLDGEPENGETAQFSMLSTDLPTGKGIDTMYGTVCDIVLNAPFSLCFSCVCFGLLVHFFFVSLFRVFIGGHDFQHDTMTVYIITEIIGSAHNEIAHMRPEIETVCRISGYEPPIICTPDELMEK